MYRFRPDYEILQDRFQNIQGKSLQAKSIMLMIQNNLSYAVAQHPHELITYGGNGAVFPKLGAISFDHEIFVRNDG